MFWSPLFLLPIFYAAMVSFMSLFAGRSLGEFGRLMIVYPAIHLSWGCGFLVGVRDL
jgi:hypothetical protein